MESETLNELFVELSGAVQKEIADRIIAVIRDDAKRKRWWRRLRRWIGSFHKLKCICGATGGGCECECDEPKDIESHHLPVRVASKIREITEV